MFSSRMLVSEILMSLLDEPSLYEFSLLFSSLGGFANLEIFFKLAANLESKDFSSFTETP